MVALAGPFIVTAALLGAGGVLKIHRPATAQRAMRQMGLPSSAALVRTGAAAEVAVAAGALLLPGRLFALLVAVSYFAFAAFVLAAIRRRVPLASCGCFGIDDTPPTSVHLAINLSAALVAGAVAMGSGEGLRAITSMEGSTLLRVVFVVLTAASAWFAYVALTLLPRVLGAGARSSA